MSTAEIFLPTSHVPTALDHPIQEHQVRVRNWYHWFKAGADVAIALVLLVLTAPLIGLMVVLVRLGSRGPGIYRQVRVGRSGRLFTIYKIRTMTHDCERSSGPKWSVKGDARVTRLGKLLRKSHLDELPQLWNVVRREMSLVGPRPERPEFVDDLAKAIPGYLKRLEVLPGITGLAQVHLPPDENLAGVRLKLKCDALYVDTVGPWLDARLLAVTGMMLLGVPTWRVSRFLRIPNPTTSPQPEAAATERDEPVSQLQIQTA
jgi:lipopolysaccharide/colanic/teichoic acid biosynthesis glycosyltransferase